jgi:hypothetical protein
MSRQPTSRAGCVAIVALAGALSAGCATTRYTQSALAPVPRSAEGGAAAKSRTAVSVEIERVKLRVATLDRAPQGGAIPRLGVRVVFDTPELGYSFDPGQAVLRSADGREWRAQGGNGHRPLFPDATVDLWFDAVVEESATFELVLDGLARGTTTLDSVTLRLSRRSGRSIDRVYWLEALLAPLAYGY